MADQVAIVEKIVTNADLILSGGTADFTDPSITQTFSAAILIFSHVVNDDENKAHGILGMGFIGASGIQATSTLQCAVTVNLEANVAVGPENETDRFLTGCVLVTDGTAAGSRDVEAEFDSAITNGFRLDFGTFDAAALPNGIKITAIIFAGLAKAAVGNCSFTDGGSTHEDTGTSGDLFQPDLLIFRSSDDSLSTATNAGSIALGFALNRLGIPQKSAYIDWQDSSDPTEADGYLRSDCASAAFLGTLRDQMDRFQVLSFDSTGFNAIAIDTGGINTPQANYLALKFSDAALNLATANLSVSSSTGSQVFSSIGFQPAVVLGMSTLLTTEDTLTGGTTAASAGLFCFTSSVSRAYSVHNEDGLSLNPASQNCNTRQGDHAVLTLSHTGSVAQQASLTGMTGMGFTLNFSTATAGFLTVLAIGAGTVVSVNNETEQISDQALVNLISKRALDETEQISDGFAAVLADALPGLGPAGYVFEDRAARGAVLEEDSGVAAGVVLG